QNKNQNLQRRSFRPFNADWAELKLIASAHGMTATLLFVLLLELDAIEETSQAMDLAQAGVDPTILSSCPIVFTQTIYRTRSKIKKYSRFGKEIFAFKI
ncbi:MAG: DUF1564 domain-containing protein, partial [Leptospira sp.]|nr:DUF1564 domain-containing protein [Leptospira sp.]